MTVTEFLKTQVPFLQGLTDDQAAYLAQRVDQQMYKKGQTILFKGVSVEGLHVIAQGKATVHAKIDPKKPLAKVADLGPGDIFGETSILEFAMASATIKCAEDSTLLFVISQELFREVLMSDPELEKRIKEIIALRRAGVQKSPSNEKVEKPAEKPAEEPVPQPAEKPAEDLVPQPVEKPAEQTIPDPAEKPAE
ncbi:cyclic nucleotide-binding domain-containing protein [Elusimicrobiota bacterium]